MKMTSSKLKCVSLLLIFAVLVGECSAQRSKWDNIHASITNDISEGVQLKINCKSKDTDFGDHYLTHGAEFAWVFKINIFETTLYWCNMWVNDVYKGSYDMYKAKRDWRRCENECHFYARRDGVYGFIKEKGDFELVYPWPN
ncbi:hypothetical protein MKX01_034043 [Papaver californicum]|nr:hypothetical protein MKX01_034043 [Papaver californicum]